METYRRFEIVIRNIGKELPEVAVGVLSIDFGTDVAFRTALQTLNQGLRTSQLPQAIVLENDRGEMLGFNPHHYSYHTVLVDELGEWQAASSRWTLPAAGSW